MAELNRSLFSWSTTVILKDTYMPNTLVNICAAVPAILVSAGVLYVALTTTHLRGQFKIPIVSLCSCSLFSASASLIFHAWYLLRLWKGAEVNFMACSILRRLYDHGETPRIFCNLIIALDRYFTVIHNLKFIRKLIITLIVSSTCYTAIGTLFNLLSGKAYEGDLCGPTLAAPHYFRNIVLGGWCTVTFIAFVLNVRLLLFVFSRRGFLPEIKWMSVGITVQSFIPLIPFTMIVINLFCYYNYGPAFIPQWYWLLSLAIGYSNNTTIPLITALSIGSFRKALRKRFKKIRTFPLLVPYKF